MELGLEFHRWESWVYPEYIKSLATLFSMQTIPGYTSLLNAPSTHLL